MEIDKTLSEKQMDFVRKYFHYKEIGEKKSNQKIAEEVGLVNQGEKFVVNARIKRALKLVEERQEDELALLGITKARILETLYKVATVDARDFFNEDGTLKDIKSLPPEAGLSISSIETYKDGRVKNIKLWDKVKSLELLGKQAGMFTEKIEIKNDIVDKIKKARERVINFEKEIIDAEIVDKKQDEGNKQQ